MSWRHEEQTCWQQIQHRENAALAGRRRKQLLLATPAAAHATDALANTNSHAKQEGKQAGQAGRPDN